MCNHPSMPLRFQPGVLERARLERGLSPTQLARLANVSHQSILNIERGLSVNPQAAKVKSLADALGIPVADLYEETAPEGDAA